MKVRIDGNNEHIIIANKKDYTYIEIQQMYLNTLAITKLKTELPEMLCKLYHFEKLPFYDDIRVDYCIDTDINLVYIPKY